MVRCNHRRASAVRLGLTVSIPFVAAVPFLGGCFSISIAPACPRELDVGETGTVWANELNPGAIPTYKWEVIPANAGTFTDPDEPMTQFTAAKSGDAVIQLTAADGLYQVVSRCVTKVVGSGEVSVELTVDPNPVTLGEDAILFCTSTGTSEAATLSLAQTAGATVTLSVLTQGVATFTALQTGTLTFQCIGRSVDGLSSDPSVVTVTVEEDDGRGGGRR